MGKGTHCAYISFQVGGVYHIMKVCVPFLLSRFRSWTRGTNSEECGGVLENLNFGVEWIL
jgi:hypothetical protein